MLFFFVLEIEWYAVLLPPIMDLGNAGNCHRKGIDNCLVFTSLNLKWKGSVTIRKSIFYVQY